MDDVKKQAAAVHGSSRGARARPELNPLPFAPAKSWLTAALVYLAYALAVLFPVWSRDVDPIWDARDYFLPSFAFLADAVRDGTVPLWDPFTNCGVPFHADPQAPLLNPVALALARLVSDPNTGFALFWTFHWVWAGLGMLVLAGALGACPTGGLIAAISFSMSGFFVGHAEHTPYVVTASWLPWAVGLAHHAVARRDARLAILAGLSLGMSALGGYPGLVAYSAFFLASWLALAFILRRRAREDSYTHDVKWVVGVLAAVGALLVLIWLPVLDAFLSEAREYTSRAGPLSLAEATRTHPFSFRAALSLGFPKLVIQARDWFPADVSMNNAYVGALGLPLAAVWVAAKPRERMWIAVLAAFSFAVALGGEALVRTALYYAVPPTRYMRHNAAFRLYIVLPLAAAAGAGAALVIRDPDARRALLRFLSGWLAALAVAAVPIAVMLLRRELATRPVLGVVLPAAGICAGALTLLAAARRSRRVAGAVGSALVLLIAVDLGWHVRKNSAVSWTPLDPLLARLATAPDAPEPEARRDFQPFGPWSNLHQFVRQPVVEGYVTMRSAAFNDGLVRGPFREVLQAHRYWLSPSSEAEPPREIGVPALASLGATSPIPVFVDEAADVLPGDPVVPGTFGSVRIVKYSNERIRLAIDVPGDRGAILASSERYAPGWRASVDGTPARVARVGYVFRGVRLLPGSHVVEFEYSPRRYWPLVAGSAVTVFVALMWVASAFVRRPRGGQLRTGSPSSTSTLRGW